MAAGSAILVRSVIGLDFVISKIDQIWRESWISDETVSKRTLWPLHIGTDTTWDRPMDVETVLTVNRSDGNIRRQRSLADRQSVYFFINFFINNPRHKL